MSGQASCGVPKPLEITTGTPWPSLLHARRRVPSTDVTDRNPNACLPTWRLDYLADGRSVGTRAKCSPRFHCSAVLSYMCAAGTIAPWDEFWDSYFAWELEPVDDTVRIRTDLAAVSEDAAYASTHEVYAQPLAGFGRE